MESFGEARRVEAGTDGSRRASVTVGASPRSCGAPLPLLHHRRCRSHSARAQPLHRSRRRRRRSRRATERRRRRPLLLFSRVSAHLRRFRFPLLRLEFVRGLLDIRPRLGRAGLARPRVAEEVVVRQRFFRLHPAQRAGGGNGRRNAEARADSSLLAGRLLGKSGLLCSAWEDQLSPAVHGLLPRRAVVCTLRRLSHHTGISFPLLLLSLPPFSGQILDGFPASCRAFWKGQAQGSSGGYPSWPRSGAGTSPVSCSSIPAGCASRCRRLEACRRSATRPASERPECGR